MPTSNFQYISTVSACKCLPKVPIKLKPCQPSILIVSNSLLLAVVRKSMIFVVLCSYVYVAIALLNIKK